MGTSLYVNLPYESRVNRLAQNENPYGPSPKAMEAVLKNIHEISHYPNVVETEMKEKLADKHRVKPEEIIVSNGSVAIIEYLVRQMMPYAGNMVIPQITFVAYKLCAAIYSKECRLVPMDNYSINLNRVAEYCDEKTRLVFLANPNNPTGTIFSHEEIAGFLQKMPAQTLVVLDEAYIEYVQSPLYPDSIQLFKKYPNVIILHSFSKIYGLAGLRIGYGIADQAIVTELEDNRLPFMVGTISNIAALAALEDDEYVKKSISLNARGRDYLYKGLTELGYKVIPSEANFLYVSFPSTAERDIMHDRLFANKIVVRKMESFGDSHSLRISIGKRNTNIQIMKCLKNKNPSSK
jgi:histidinol-phosphate aminotransferase